MCGTSERFVNDFWIRTNNSWFSIRYPLGQTGTVLERKNLFSLPLKFRFKYSLIVIDHHHHFLKQKCDYRFLKKKKTNRTIANKKGKTEEKLR